MTPRAAGDPATHQADVVVLGGGLAGMTAATRAAERGRDVVVLERGEHDGGAGNTRISGGVFHLAWCAMDAPTDELLARLVEETDGEIDQQMAETLAHTSERAMRWLTARGLDIRPKGPRAHERFTLQPWSSGRGTRHVPERGADIGARRLYTAARELGVRIILGAEVEGLQTHRRASTRITYSSRGEAAHVDADAVVVADGGFQGSCERLDLHVAPKASTSLLRAASSSRGTGLGLATAAGASMRGSGRVYGHVLSRTAKDDDRLWPQPTLDKLCLDALLLDPRGHRFATRASSGIALVNELLQSAQPDGFTVVFDVHIRSGDGTETPTPDEQQLGQREGHMPSVDVVIDKGAEVHEADSLEELAQRIGLPRRSVLAAAKEHAAAHPDRALTGSPYYAMPIIPGISLTMDGLAVDGACRVLDDGAAPIRTLYAAGDVTATHGGPRGGYLGGLAVALVQGLVAGESAASDVAD